MWWNGCGFFLFQQYFGVSFQSDELNRHLVGGLSLVSFIRLQLWPMARYGYRRKCFFDFFITNCRQCLGQLCVV
uniref:Uncharacterized protein n=1 Tax=Anguilla anguilla TaxID=7936 RepID=A0A0E9X568_ANGAN